MDHVAILKRSWNLTPKILSGEKAIESRWYKAKFPPWDRISVGDTVYFKDSGGPVKLTAKVGRILQFSNFDREKVRWLIDTYGGVGKINFVEKERRKLENFLLGRKYCILVFLRGVHSVEPFNIDKSGFGASSAWVCVESINKIRRPPKIRGRPNGSTQV